MGKSELQASFEQQIVSTSTASVQDIIVPNLDQKLSNKVNKDDLRPVIEEIKAPMKTELKSELKTDMDQQIMDRKAELQETFQQQIVSTSTAIVQDIIVPDLDQKLSNKVNKDDLRPVMEEMKAPLKTELKSELKTDMDQQITDRLEGHTPNLETIVTASSAIVSNILIPDMEQKLTAKFNEVKEVVKDDLETKMDQDLSSGMTDLSQQIDTKINGKGDELTQQITTRITEAQDKVIFAVVRKNN